MDNPINPPPIAAISGDGKRGGGEFRSTDRRAKMQIPTVGENQEQMRDLAVALMRESYAKADRAAKEQRPVAAKSFLKSAERWRVKARGHGAAI